MSDIAIRVENLGKQYRIGGQQQPYRTFREVLSAMPLAPVRLMRTLFGQNGSGYETFWALKEVSFEIKQGEVTGVIGRNGAGKSTLLKILARITEPTEGQAEIHGRVGSLLEVGTGFHPELTGRENIYLNGSILGMKRAEIARKFDEIVAFAEVEKFIETPVKHYSSGMYLRLAFAVAAHLEPEILLVDEVLAVGDAEFQQKCLGKMQDVAQQGRTVLFVSHNMAAILNLCNTAYLLQSGCIEKSGPVREVIDYYINTVSIQSLMPLTDRPDRSGRGQIRFTKIGFRNSNQHLVKDIPCGEELHIELEYEALHLETLNNISVSINFTDTEDNNLISFSDKVFNKHWGSLPGKGKLVCEVEKLPLVPGRYFVSFALTNDGLLEDKMRNAASFTVIEGDFFGTGRLPSSNLSKFLVPCRWRHDHADE